MQKALQYCSAYLIPNGPFRIQPDDFVLAVRGVDQCLVQLCQRGVGRMHASFCIVENLQFRRTMLESKSLIGQHRYTRGNHRYKLSVLFNYPVG